MKHKMFNEFSLPHDVFEDKKFKSLKPCSRIFYCYLAKLKNRYSDNEGWFFRSMETLAEDTGLSISTLKVAKKELIINHLIDVKRGKMVKTKQRSPDYYRLNGFKVVTV